MTVRKLHLSTTLLPGRRVVKFQDSTPIASPGDEVTLKPNVPDELTNYKELIGKWQGQVGEYSQVHFPGLGGVSIKSAYLIVM